MEEVYYNDYELLYLIRQKNDMAFALLMKKYEEIAIMLMKKYSRTYKIGISEDDYLQMARIKLLQSINEYREDQEASFYHYFCNVFHNLLIDLYRHSLREKHIVSLDSCIQEEEGSYCLLDIMEKPNESFYVSYEFQHRVNSRKETLSSLEKEFWICVPSVIRISRLPTLCISRQRRLTIRFKRYVRIKRVQKRRNILAVWKSEAWEVDA